MKTFFFILIFLTIPSLTFGQYFKPIVPNIKKLKEQNIGEENNEVIYNYLTNNYRTTSKKFDIERYEWDKSKICAFTQEFENGIKYAVSECKEGGGLTVELEFPKIKRTKLMKWIEKIHAVNKTEIDQNVWKENNSKFEPREVNPGCYYKINEKEEATLIEVYCGC